MSAPPKQRPHPGAGVRHAELPVVRPCQAVPAAARRAIPRGDVSPDPVVSRDLIRRTGQVGGRVVDIAGRPIMGFDKPQFDWLRGLTR